MTKIILAINLNIYLKKVMGDETLDLKKIENKNHDKQNNGWSIPMMRYKYNKNVATIKINV